MSELSARNAAHEFEDMCRHVARARLVSNFETFRSLPHILVRFFTVPDATAARRSMRWAVGLIGGFFALLSLLGFGARYVLGPPARRRCSPPRAAATWPCR
ncbi:hypothetical protein [Baekduia alba]|uniref:hypothetical protein n=1 Tax=Baekduia alba TaxID=2997333 RepID=UPI00233FA4B9|nr:hypothetical protein [Baekduia alba]